MADCIYRLKSQCAADAPYGGYWVYNGYSTSSKTGPFTDTPASPLFPGISAGDPLGLGDNPVVDDENKTTGYYSFTYNYIGGSNTCTIQIVDDSICAGIDTSLTVTDSDATAYDLDTLVQNASCPSVCPSGVWNDLDGAGGSAFDGDAFTPANVGSPGTYRFKLACQEPGFVAKECSDCNIESTVTFEVIDSFDAYLTQGSGTCTYEIDLKHPDTTTSGDVKVTISNDDESPTFEFDKIVTDTCRSTDVLNIAKTKNNLLYGTVFWNTDNLQEGGNFTKLTIASSTSGTVEIPVSPSSATLSGTAGSVTPTDLQYYILTADNFANSLRIVIKNWLEANGYTDKYKLITISAGTNNRRQIEFFFGSKHNPSTEWLGIERSVSTVEYQVKKGASLNTNTSWSFLASGLSLSEHFSESPCPLSINKLSYITTGNLYSDFIDDTTLDYNLIPLTTATVDTSVAASSNLTHDCDGILLTAVSLNCAGTVTYLWNTGATTNNITVVSGNYSVDVDCDSPVNSKTLTISL